MSRLTPSGGEETHGLSGSRVSKATFKALTEVFQSGYPVLMLI